MADPERQRAALRSLLAKRVPEEAASTFTDEQIDALLAAGYSNETFLAGLQLEDLPNPPFLPAVRNLLLRTYGSQTGVGVKSSADDADAAEDPLQEQLQEAVNWMSPKDFGKLGYKLALDQEQVTFMLGMPVEAQGPPAETIHPAFGRFKDLVQSAEPDTSTYDAYQTLSREMCTSYLNTSTPTCTAILAKVGAEGHKRGGEQVRLRLFRSAMCKFFAEQGLSIRNIDAYVTKGGAATDGALAVYQNGTAFFNFCLIEGKEGMGENNGGWSYPQMVFYAGQLICEHKNEPLVNGTSCPILGLEVMGHHFRVVAIFYTTHVCAQPLTAYLHFGPQWPGHHLYVEYVMRVLKAAAECLKDLQAFYLQCMQSTPKSPASREAFNTPYMLRSDSPYNNVHPLMDHDRVWTAVSPDGSNCLLKLVLGPYPTELHLDLAKEALVPQLRDATSYPGGMLLLEMELLAGADGWLRLDDMGSMCNDWDAFEQHLLRHLERFTGADDRARRVHGDLRGPNLMVRLDDAGMVTDVRILDLDFAGIEGTARYGFGMNAKVKWPIPQPDGKKILAAHDRHMLQEVVRTYRPMAMCCGQRGKLACAHKGRVSVRRTMSRPQLHCLLTGRKFVHLVH